MLVIVLVRVLVSVLVSAFDNLKIARAVLVILHNKCTHCLRSVSQLNVLAQCVSSECKSVC